MYPDRGRKWRNELKICTKCGETKTLDEFHRRKDSRDGLRCSCKDCRNEGRRKWGAENREKERARNHKYRSENSDKERERHRRWSEANPDRQLRWQRANRDKVMVYNHSRRARKASAEGSHTALDIEAMFLRWPQCLCCGTEKDLTGDHVVSLKMGGDDWPSNLQTLCGRCNKSKGAQNTDYRYPYSEHILMAQSKGEMKWTGRRC